MQIRSFYLIKIVRSVIALYATLFDNRSRLKFLLMHTIKKKEELFHIIVKFF